MFDIYFSLAHGFEIDFPFLAFWLPTELFLTIIVLVIALRIRKVFISRNRNSFSKVENNFVNEFENDFDVDWSK